MEIILKNKENAGEKANLWEEMQNKLKEFWKKIDPVLALKSVNVALAEKLEKSQQNEKELEKSIEENKKIFENKLEKIELDLNHKKTIISKFSTLLQSQLISQKSQYKISIDKIKSQISTLNFQNISKQILPILSKYKNTINSLRDSKKTLEKHKQTYE